MKRQSPNQSARIGDRFDWLDRVMAAAIDSHDVTEFELDFASKMAIRLNRYKANTMVSDKQIEIAEQMAKKLGID